VLKYFSLIIVAISWLALLPATGQGADTEFKSLLAADTLDSWETIGPAKWRVTKGELVTGQGGDPKRWGMLQTKSKYRDFELKLDFKIDEYGKYNSGVYLRQPTERGVGRPYQVNIGRGVAGEPVGLHLDDWLAKGDEHDKIRRALKWNSLRIRIVESHIEVWLNGKQIVDFTHENPKPYLLKAGPIALQTYGAEGHSGWVRFRNMQLKDLSK
jgi:hypothetical protein